MFRIYERRYSDLQAAASSFGEQTPHKSQEAISTEDTIHATTANLAIFPDYFTNKTNDMNDDMLKSTLTELIKTIKDKILNAAASSI